MIKINTKFLLFCFLFIIQLLTLISYCKSEIEPFPPGYSDQAGFLREIYSLSMLVQKDGLGAIADAVFQSKSAITGSANSVLFVPEETLLNLFGGGTRLSELSLNFSAFLLAEVILYISVTFLTKQTGLGLAAVGLLLSIHSMWNIAGGIFDLRIDFLALCLYGMVICAALRSGIFLSRRWTIATALCMIFLILNRFITSVYIFGIMSVIIIAVVSLGAKTKLASFRIRARNAVLCLFIVGAVFAPMILINHHAIYDYYVVGHLTGPEKAIRAKGEGVTDFIKALEYYPVSLSLYHLGAPFGFGCLVVLLATILGIFGRRTKDGEPNRLYDSIIEVVFILTSILVPLFILTLDESKSPVVAGIVCIPVILLVSLLPRWLGVSEFNISRAFRYNRRVWLGVGCIVLVFGLFTQLNYGAIERAPPVKREGLQHWADATMWLFDDSRDRQIVSPKIFFDTVIDRLNPAVFETFGYEKTRSLVVFQTSFGDSIFGFDPAQPMAALPVSDYVILTTGPKSLVYPFFESMAAVEPQVRAWAQDHLILRRRFEMDYTTVEIYSKPVTTLYGVSGDWLLSHGTILHIVPDELKPGQIIAIQGPDQYKTYLPVEPDVSAIANVAGHDAVAIPATFHRIGDRYEIDLDPSPLRIFGGKGVDIALSFNKFFVPSALGMNPDTRELVIMKPTSIEIR